MLPNENILSCKPEDALTSKSTP